MTTLRKTILSGMLLAATSMVAQPLNVDLAHSEVGFSIKHMMISKVKGEFDKFDAKIDYDIKTKKFNSLVATIDTNSINTGITKRDNHLRSADFFEVKKHPSMKFVMSSYDSSGDEGTMVGDLTIHGITKRVKLDVTINGVIKDFQGKTRVGFTLEGKVNRKDFGLTWNKLIEAGGLAVGDKVKISVELETIAH